ncbi:MAG: Ig-like domain-containing protein [Acidobacteriota bacterium]
MKSERKTSCRPPRAAESGARSSKIRKAIPRLIILATLLLPGLSHAAGCVENGTTLCLNGDRFQAKLTWENAAGGGGNGHVAASSELSGVFRFFDPINWEAQVKVIDGCAANGKFWVLSSSTTNLEYTLEVTDTNNGAVNTYFNPLNQVPQANIDTTAFNCSGASSGKSVTLSPSPPLTQDTGQTSTSTCTAGGQRLCLADDRFKAELTWRNFTDPIAAGNVVPGATDMSGLFYFADSENWEVLVKVIDQCATSNRFWVLAGASTNLEYELKITDTETGAIKTYFNPLGTPSGSVVDTQAFATCNQPPVAVDDQASTDAGDPVFINVVANDYDPGGLDLFLATSPNPIVDPPDHGTAVRHNADYIRYTPDVGYGGTDTFRYRVTATDGETDTAEVTVTVAPPPPPDITLVNRRTIPLDNTTTVIVRGRHMANATIHIPEIDDPTRVAPTVVSIDVMPVGEQHRYDIVLDTSDPKTEGPFAIVIENEAGPEAAVIEDVRVVPNRPVVDAYTPSVAAEGAAFVMMAVGANLQDATVQSNHPNITIAELDVSQDDAISGLLLVESGAPPGNFSLTIGRPGGGVVELPFELPQTFLGAKPIDYGEELTKGTGSAFPIYFQPPVFTQTNQISSKLGTASGHPTAGHSHATTADGESASGGDPQASGGEKSFCQFPITLARARQSSHGFGLNVVPLNLAGMVDPTQLADMEVDEIRRLGAGGVALLRSVTLFLDVQYCLETGRLSFQVCIVATLGAEYLGGSGQLITVVQCVPGTGYYQTEATNGTLDYFQFSAPGPCASILPPGPPQPPEGQFATNVRLEQCCPETVNYSTSGTAFQTSIFATDFTSNDRPLAVATPTCGADRFDVEVRAFIPMDHINVAPLGCIDIAGFGKDLLVVGDDRGFDPNPPLSEAATNGFRLERSVSVIPNAAGCNATPGCTSRGELAGTRNTKTGRSDNFAEDALDNAPIGQITLADYDSQLHDCHLWDEFGHTTPSTNLLSVVRVDSDTVRIQSTMAARDPIILASPDIDWNFSLTLNDDGTYSVTGTHDCFPAFEVYVNDEWVWGYRPTTSFFPYVGCCLSGVSPVSGSCSGSLDDPSPCFMNIGHSCPF